MSGNDYKARQLERDLEYRQAYSEWLLSLSAEDLKRVKQLGLESPSMPIYETKNQLNAADSNDASESMDFAAEIDHDQPREQGRELEVIRR